jgi:predicted 3-demethylubiquinone-9 3-methyltransferase (glyoxalase superfamily)
MADTTMQKIGGDVMTTLTPYLLFDGNCHQAMEFYKSCFGGELTVTKVKDSPAKHQMPPVQLNKNYQCTTQKRESGDFGVGLATA